MAKNYVIFDILENELKEPFKKKADDKNILKLAPCQFTIAEINDDKTLEKGTRWDVEDYLGQGYFGQAYLIKQQGTNELKVLKVLMQDNDREVEIVRTLPKEIIDHENIMTYYGSGIIFKRRLSDFYNFKNVRSFILMRRVHNFEVFALVNLSLTKYARSVPISEGAIRVLVNDMARGMNCLYKNGFCNLDFKPENLLLDNFGRVIISDFGLCRALNNVRLSDLKAGTKLFFCPLRNNALKGAYINPALFDCERSEIFSLGSILFFIAGKNFPFGTQGVVPGPQYASSFWKNYNPKRFPNDYIDMSDSFKTFLSTLWNMNPTERPKFEDLICALNKDTATLTLFPGLKWLAEGSLDNSDFRNELKSHAPDMIAFSRIRKKYFPVGDRSFRDFVDSLKGIIVAEESPHDELSLVSTTEKKIRNSTGYNNSFSAQVHFKFLICENCKQTGHKFDKCPSLEKIVAEEVSNILQAPFAIIDISVVDSIRNQRGESFFSVCTERRTGPSAAEEVLLERISRIGGEVVPDISKNKLASTRITKSKEELTFIGKDLAKHISEFTTTSGVFKSKEWWSQLNRQFTNLPGEKGALDLVHFKKLENTPDGRENLEVDAIIQFHGFMLKSHGILGDYKSTRRALSDNSIWYKNKFKEDIKKTVITATGPILVYYVLNDQSLDHHIFFECCELGLSEPLLATIQNSTDLKFLPSDDIENFPDVIKVTFSNENKAFDDAIANVNKNLQEFIRDMDSGLLQVYIKEHNALYVVDSSNLKTSEITPPRERNYHLVEVINYLWRRLEEALSTKTGEKSKDLLEKKYLKIEEIVNISDGSTQNYSRQLLTLFPPLPSKLAQEMRVNILKAQILNYFFSNDTSNLEDRIEEMQREICSDILERDIYKLKEGEQVEIQEQIDYLWSGKELTISKDFIKNRALGYILFAKDRIKPLTFEKLDYVKSIVGTILIPDFLPDVIISLERSLVSVLRDYNKEEDEMVMEKIEFERTNSAIKREREDNIALEKIINIDLDDDELL